MKIRNNQKRKKIQKQLEAKNFRNRRKIRNGKNLETNGNQKQIAKIKNSGNQKQLEITNGNKYKIRSKW